MEFHKTLAERSGIQVILQTIKEHGPVSKRELQQMTGFSWAHISQVTSRLMEEGYIVTGRSRLQQDAQQTSWTSTWMTIIILGWTLAIKMC